MSSCFETAMAVQLGMMWAQNCNTKKVHPSEYDPEDLLPNVDASLPPDQYMEELMAFLSKPLLTKEEKKRNLNHR